MAADISIDRLMTTGFSITSPHSVFDRDQMRSPERGLESYTGQTSSPLTPNNSGKAIQA